MDMLDAMVSAAQRIFSLGPLLTMLAVLPIALIAGIKPGGNLPMLVVLLSFAGYVDPWILIPTAVFWLAATDAGEPVPSILLGIPGGRASQATVLDGYPMSQKGLAGIALGASYTCTLIGGLFGALVLILILPFSFDLLLRLSSAEFFLLTLLGIMIIGIVSSGAMAKGLLTGALGIAIATVGLPTGGGTARATFGLDYLWDGIHLVPIVVGLFSIPEMVALAASGKTIARERVDVLLREAQHDIYKGMLEALKHWGLLLRSSLIGVIVGIIPGVGGGVGHWMAYAVARQTEPGAKESFGKGDLRGVIASDAANNSSDGGQLIPTLVLGIPGSGSMALLVGMLVLAGVVPGPRMLTENLDLVFGCVFALILGMILSVPVMIAFAPWLARITLIPPDILAPMVIALTTLGAFMATYSMGDLMVAAIMGILGTFMKRYGWPRPPILIAVALGGLLEKNMLIALGAFGFSMLFRPAFVIILVILAVFMIIGVRLQKRAGGANMAATAEAMSAATEPVPDSSFSCDKSAEIGFRSGEYSRFSIQFVGEFTLLALTGLFFGYMVVDTLPMSFEGRLLPWLAVGIGIPFWLILVVNLFRRGGVTPQEMIMDTGFLTGEDPKAEIAGLIRISLFIVGLYLGIWLFGFHVAVPTALFLYLLIVARAGWIGSVSVGLAFETLIVGVFDWTLNIPWHEPVVSYMIP